MPKGDATYPAMTIDECLAFADEWSRGVTLYPGAQGWRVVCMLLAEEVRGLRAVELMRNEEIESVREKHGNALMNNDRLSENVALLMAQLAEGQAREAKLRTAVKRSLHNGSNTLLHEVVRLPSDDSALREMIEAAKAEERQACAKEAERQMEDEPYGHAKFRCANIAEAIRARKGWR